MQREDVTQQPEQNDLQTPHWVPPPPPAFGERAWFEMFFEQYGFMFALVVTLLVLVTLFYNYDILLSEPQAERTREVAHSLPLSVVTLPAGATVLIDGDSIGVSPVANHPVRRGAYFLTIRKDNFVPLDTIITLTDEPKALAFTLRDEAADTSGATLAELEALAPVLDAVEADDVEEQEADQPDVAAEANTPRQPPADPAPEPVREVPPATTAEDVPAAVVEADDDPTPPQRREAPVVGSLRITSDPEGATVSVDGAVSGTTPLTLNGLVAGTHTVSFHRDGYDTYSTSVSVEAGDVSEVAVSLTARPVEVRILPKPWGAIYIDGTLHQREANIWYTVQLSPGNHRIRVEHPSLGQWEQVINVQPGEPRELVIDFNME